MYRRALCWAATAVALPVLLLASSGRDVVASAPSYATTLVSSDTVPKIACIGPRGGGTGTGVRVGPDIVLTAAHVADIGVCLVDGQIASRVQSDSSLDFAILRTASRPGWWKVNCAPMEFGEEYQALGYAKGGPIHRQWMYGTINHPFPRSVMPGFGDTGMMVGRERFIPGMSGGPVIRTSDGALVGLVIGFNKGIRVSYARFLSDTEVCRAA